MAYKIKNPKKDEIKFKTEAKAKKYLKQLQSLDKSYTRTTFFRKGKIVYRY